jgi:DNA-binding CsgD family transcriptional regulator
MVYHKLKPILSDRATPFGLCLLSISVIHNIGNLRTYYKDSLDYDEYTRGVWKRLKIRSLSRKERSILMLIGEGKTIKEIADVLNVSPKTIQNTESSLFKKLCVHSMLEAFIYAQNHQMIHVSQPLQHSESLNKTPNKKTRRLLTNEMITYIQHGIDNGFSINWLAKEVDITEGAIRYAVKQGKLKRSMKIRKKNNNGFVK